MPNNSENWELLRKIESWLNKSKSINAMNYYTVVKNNGPTLHGNRVLNMKRFLRELPGLKEYSHNFVYKVIRTHLYTYIYIYIQIH